MVAFKHIFLFLATASAWVVPRNVNTVLNNLKSIDAAINKFTADTKAWDGTAGGSITIQNDYKDLDNKIKSTTDEIKKESTLTPAEIQTLANYFANPIKPDAIAAINVLVSRKSDVTKAGLTSLVKSDLTTLRQDFGTLCGIFGGSGGNPTGKSACSSIDSAISSGILVFS